MRYNVQSMSKLSEFQENNQSEMTMEKEACRSHNLSEKMYQHLRNKYRELDIEAALRKEAKRNPIIRKIETFLIERLGEKKAIELKTYLGRWKKPVLALASPIGWFGLVFRPVLIFLGVHPFWYFQSFLTRIEKRNVSWSLSAKDEEMAKKVVEELRVNGIACWPGLFNDPTILASAQKDAEMLINKSYATLENFPLKMGDVREPEFGHRFLRNDPLDDMGRTRVRLDGWSGNGDRSKWPVWMQAIYNDQRFLQVAKNRFGVPAPIKRCSIDESVPSLYPVGWHVDTVCDSVKSVILLTDCDISHGPMQYKIGSHRLNTNPIKQMYYYIFKHGDPYQYPGQSTWRQAPGEVMLATGKAGDCYFFDTRGLHATLPCTSGKRLVCFTAFTVQSFRNKVLDSINVM